MWKTICAAFVISYVLIAGTWADTCYSEFCTNHSISPRNDRPPQCIITHIQRGPQCTDMKFENQGHLPPPGVPLADVKLSAYVAKGRVTAFNLTVNDINFRGLTTRYQDLGNLSSSHCRHIKFDGFKELSINPDIYVSCPFSNNLDFENTSYRLEYLIRGDDYEYSRKFVFNVPDHRKIDERLTDLREFIPFTYVDVSDISSLSLYIQPLPEKFNITIYRVWIINNDTETVDIVDLTPSNSRDHIKYSFQVSEGTHSFYVTAIHRGCSAYGCINGTLPAIITKQPTKRLLIMIISVVWIPPVILYGIYYIYKLYEKKDLLKRIGRRPNCFLVYSPTHISHVNVVSNLAKYLRSCNINAMIDILDIPETPTRDPGLWCNEAFKSADTIVVLTSPSLGTSSVPIIYRNVDNHALRLLKENYSLRNKRYISVEFPYCRTDELPEEAKLFKKFKLPENLDKFIKYLHNVELIRFFGVSSNAFIESMNLAMLEIPRERQNTPKNINETDDLLSVGDKSIMLNVVNDSMEIKCDEVDEQSENRYYATNIDELNLLGDSKQIQGEIKFRSPINDGDFHIDQLKL